MMPPSLDDLPPSDEDLDYGEHMSAAWEDEEANARPDYEYEDCDDGDFPGELLIIPGQELAIWSTDHELVICDADPNDPICAYCLNSCTLLYRFSEN